MNFNVPINSTSLGQVSLSLLREAFKRNLEPNIFPIGKVEVGGCSIDKSFSQWLSDCINKSPARHNRDEKILKLWHLMGGLESFAKDQVLLSFYELDSPTPFELNVAKNNKTVFTSSYTCALFKERGVDTNFVPLAFDDSHFKRLDKKFVEDDRITFNIVGKLERRKHHSKAIKALVKKYGNNKKFAIQACIYNNFMNAETNAALINQILEGKTYFNFNNIPWIKTNDAYNEFLNSADIVIGASGGEGWGLPEFHSVAMGKHAVLMKAHSYLDWATEEMVSFFNPNQNKIEAYDGLFFHKGQNINQGSIFDFNEDEFVAACEQAVAKVEKSRVNEAGLKLQDKFTYSNTFEQLNKI